MRGPVALTFGLSLVIVNVQCNDRIDDPSDEMVPVEKVLKELTRSNYPKKRQLHRLQNSLRDVKNERDDYKEALEKAENDAGELQSITYSAANNNLVNSPLHWEQDISNLSMELRAVWQEQELTTSRLSSMQEQLQKLMTNFVFKGCRSPPEVPNADVIYNGDFLHAVASYTCKPDFKPCGLQTESRRQNSGEWTANSGRCSRFKWNKPGVGFNESLPCQDQDVMHLTIKATPTAETRMQFILMGDTAALLLVDCRFSYLTLVRQIVLNDWTNGAFGQEIRPSGFPFTVNETFVMKITLSNGNYQISVGEHTWNFKQRVVGETPKKLSIQFDISIEQIEIHI